jgi:hypothetical protein
MFFVTIQMFLSGCFMIALAPGCARPALRSRGGSAPR